MSERERHLVEEFDVMALINSCVESVGKEKLIAYQIDPDQIEEVLKALGGATKKLDEEYDKCMQNGDSKGGDRILDQRGAAVGLRLELVGRQNKDMLDSLVGMGSEIEGIRGDLGELGERLQKAKTQAGGLSSSASALLERIEEDERRLEKIEEDLGPEVGLLDYIKGKVGRIFGQMAKRHVYREVEKGRKKTDWN